MKDVDIKIDQSIKELNEVLEKLLKEKNRPPVQISEEDMRTLQELLTDKPNQNTKKYLIRCKKVEVSNVYYYIGSDKGIDDIEHIIDGCNSECDLEQVLWKSGIDLYDDEEERIDYEDSFHIEEVEEM